MKLLDNTAYRYTSQIPVEDYLIQLNKNCIRCNYDLEIVVKNPWRCILRLTPGYQFRPVHNSFSQSMLFEIEVLEKVLDITITCIPAKATLPFLILFGAFGLLAVLFISFINELGPAGVIFSIIGWGLIIVGLTLTFIFIAKQVLIKLIPKEL